jgi:hypothetical protein
MIVGHVYSTPNLLLDNQYSLHQKCHFITSLMRLQVDKQLKTA